MPSYRFQAENVLSDPQPDLRGQIICKAAYQVAQLMELGMPASQREAVRAIAAAMDAYHGISKWIFSLTKGQKTNMVGVTLAAAQIVYQERNWL